MTKRLVGMIASSILVCAAEILRELHTFRVRRYRICTGKLPENRELRIAFLSDLHGRRYGRENARLMRSIRRERPDYILIGGDMLVRSQPELDLPMEKFVGALSTVCPVYLANGNHEQKMKENPERYSGRYERYREHLESKGIHFLENRSVLLEEKDCRVRVTGLEIPDACYTRLREEPLLMDDMEKRIGRISPESCYEILLAHNPAYTGRYWEWGADLVLSGHLHGGIVRLPFLGGLISPQFKIFPKYSGELHKKDGHCQIVSRGLGTHSVNIRLFNSAELVMVNLTGRER